MFAVDVDIQSIKRIFLFIVHEDQVHEAIRVRCSWVINAIVVISSLKRKKNVLVVLEQTMIGIKQIELRAIASTAKQRRYVH